MRVSTVLLLVTLTAALVMFDRSDANSLCPPCRGENCSEEPTDCRHGVVRDYCGRRVCAKGPGQKCGGSFNILGKCGEGMQCKCERCGGCSLTTLECDFSIECEDMEM